MFYNIYTSEEKKEYVVVEDNFDKEELLKNAGYELYSANPTSIASAHRMMEQLHCDYTELEHDMENKYEDENEQVYKRLKELERQ